MARLLRRRARRGPRRGARAARRTTSADVCAPTWSGRGLRDGQLGFIDGLLDPHALTIGFARRVPTYKRADADAARPGAARARCCSIAERPVQLVIAGKAHPDDAAGKAMIRRARRFAARPEPAPPDRDPRRLRHGDRAQLVPGVDVWLNNPLRPFEACGTSGMKAALNGALNVRSSTAGGTSCYDGANGWAIPSADGGRSIPSAATTSRRRRSTTCWSARSSSGSTATGRRGCRWFGTRSRCSRPTCWPRGCCATTSATCTRRPRAESRRLAADDHAGARRLATYRERVRGAWPSVAVVRSEVGDVGAAGMPVTVRALVSLGGLDPADVAVEAAVDAAAPFGVVLEPGAEEEGARWFEARSAPPRATRRSASACSRGTPTSRTRGR